MSTYKKVMQENQKLVARMCAATGVKKGLATNVVRFVKCLVKPSTGLIDSEIITIILSKYFDIIDRVFVKRTYDIMAKGQIDTSYITVEDFSKMICIFLSEDMDLKIDYVYQVYDLNHDGTIETSEINESIRNCKCITDMDEADKDETFLDLFTMTTELLGLNNGRALTLDLFREKVHQNSLFLTILGQSFPKQDVIDRFKQMVGGKTNIQMQETFGNIRQELLFELPSEKETSYYSILLDLP